ncbi:MAG TPA: adenylate/guanylate cyclase domain-containing protein [Herpetosiphonaceae bacterium]
MRYPHFYYCWTWQLAASPESLWALVSDTNRLNRAAWLPAVRQTAQRGAPPGYGRHRLQAIRLGVRLEWEEEPFEWIRPYRYGITRRYVRGPVAEMRALAELDPRPDGGTRLTYQVWARPHNLLGIIGIPVQIGILNARAFDTAFRRHAQMAGLSQPRAERPVHVRLMPGARTRLAELTRALHRHGLDPPLIARLIETIAEADNLTAAYLRPYVLADEWKAERRAVLELCLWATRIGLLDFRWDILCPLCRNADLSRSTLRDLESEAHCDSCQIDFTVNFDRLVEITFRPSPAIRQIEQREYCIGGPQVTPHIVAQQIVPPGVERALTLPLEAGRYRMRAGQRQGAQLLCAIPDGAAETTIAISDGDWAGQERWIALRPTLRITNATADEQVMILERMAWTDQAVTAADVTALQLFRDLFADEALRPGQQIAVGSLTILFTDLRDSTRLYREIGDAVAFGRVIDHFDALRHSIAAEDGVLVKTIGDAVMAIFRRPIAALRAITSAQRMLAAPAGGGQPFVLKAGLHHGPCIAVTLNDRLDYFGTTVNLAARLQSLSRGGDVVVSAAIRHDPEVAEWLADPDVQLSVCSFEAQVKGFDGPLELWRVTPAQPDRRDPERPPG